MNDQRINELLATHKLPAFRGKQLRQAFFTESKKSFADITTLSNTLREQLATEPVLTFTIETVRKSEDGLAYKALLKLTDGNFIETVLMSPKPDLWTTCISCQVGCALGCTFCATGQMGFTRDLVSEEITDQVLFWRQFLYERDPEWRLNNVVYMGMGEPFRNPDNVYASLTELMNPSTFHIGGRHLSVSTVGIAAQIPVFMERFPSVNLAVSLHAADDKLRRKLIPTSTRETLAQLSQVLSDYLKATRRKLFIEYLLLADLNDQPEHADELIRYLRTIRPSKLLHVNLIRHNETDDTYRAPRRDVVKRFKFILEKNGIRATIRKSLGEDITAACGQLASNQAESEEEQ